MADAAPASEGEDLGASVAREVMGWRRARRSWAYSDEAELWYSGEDVPLMPCPAWRPEHDDAQAMQVLEHMGSLGFRWTLAGATPGAAAEFRHPDGRRARVEDPERRRALLRAALEAVGAAP